MLYHKWISQGRRDFRIMSVASEGAVGDWAAYIMPIPDRCWHLDDATLAAMVHADGDKMMEADAVAIWVSSHPEIVLKRKWRP